MTYFIRNGSSYMVTDEDNVDIRDHLPGGNYIIKHDKFRGFYLEQVDNFEINYKLYGNIEKQSERIINTFWTRPATTGVLLTGEKGSGKTLLAKKICIDCKNQNIPTIVCNNGEFVGDEFNRFIQSIDQPCVIFFDEFEKVFGAEKQQQQMLTLLDGVFSSKKLFLLTCNDKWRIETNMRNRPGRIYYMIEFEGLDISFIREYCNDNLLNKDHIDTLCKITSLFNKFNFDMLKAIVEEINRYDETPQDVLKMLNTKPENSDETNFNVELTIDGVNIDKKNFSPIVWHGNPVHQTVVIEFNNNNKPSMVPTVDLSNVVDELDEDGEEYINFKPSHLKKIDPNGGVFIFTNGKATIRLSRVKKDKFSYLDKVF